VPKGPLATRRSCSEEFIGKVFEAAFLVFRVGPDPCYYVMYVRNMTDSTKWWMSDAWCLPMNCYVKCHPEKQAAMKEQKNQTWEREYNRPKIRVNNGPYARKRVRYKPAPPISPGIAQQKKPSSPQRNEWRNSSKWPQNWKRLYYFKDVKKVSRFRDLWSASGIRLTCMRRPLGFLERNSALKIWIRLGVAWLGVGRSNL